MPKTICAISLIFYPFCGQLWHHYYVPALLKNFDSASENILHVFITSMYLSFTSYPMRLGCQLWCLSGFPTVKKYFDLVVEKSFSLDVVCRRFRYLSDLSVFVASFGTIIIPSC